MRRVLVGVGNSMRHDDGIGLVVAERARPSVPAGVDVVLCEQEASRMIEALARADAAVVVDATACGAEAGTLQRFDASCEPLPARAFRSSTHAFGVGEAIELARALGKLPPAVVVVGVEGEEFAAGAGLSARVAAAVESAISTVLAELERSPRCMSAR